jgi:small-conductance mechanosensitive channel
MTHPIAPAVSPAQLTGNGTLAEVITTLDAIGVDIGSTRLSLWSALVVFVVVFGIFLFARMGSKAAKKVFARMTPLDPAQRLLGEKLVSVAVWALAILIGIDVLGIDLTALAVFSGALGLAMGFGLQRTFGNLIAGIILLMDRSIKPGDVIAVSDTSGRESVGQIRKIGIRAISVVTRDRKEYLIPNENLMVNQVENWSYSSRDVRVKAPVRVSYTTDLALAETLMLQATKGVARVLENPAPNALLMAFGNSAIEFEIRFWISDPEEGLSNVRSEVLKEVWRLFRENDIAIPFPQNDLRIKEWPRAPDAAG